MGALAPRLQAAHTDMKMAQVKTISFLTFLLRINTALLQPQGVYHDLQYLLPRFMPPPAMHSSFTVGRFMVMCSVCISCLAPSDLDGCMVKS